MPPVQNKAGGLMAKYGSKLAQAVNNVKEKPIELGNIELPGGIKNGVAQLSKAYFAKYETGNYKGEYYFRAVGVVVEPKEVEVDGRMMKIEGLQTSIGPLAVCETKNQKDEVTSIEENLFKITNELKKLGLVEQVENSDGSDLEELAALAVEAAPFFSFSTTLSPEKKVGNQTYPARVWQNWNGVIVDHVPEAGDIVQDDTVEPDPVPVKQVAKAPAKPAPKPSVKKPQPAPEPEPEPEDDSPVEMSLEEMAEAADGGDADVAAKLKEQLESFGFDSDKVDNATSWAGLVDEYRTHDGPAPDDDGDTPPDEEVAAEEPEPEEKPKPSAKDRKKTERQPQVDEVYIYTEFDKQGKPMKDPKTKKDIPGIEVEITKVNVDLKTVQAKNMDTGKLILGVDKKIKLIPWTHLSVPK